MKRKISFCFVKSGISLRRIKMATNNKDQIKWLTFAILAIVFIGIIVHHFPNTPASAWSKIREAVSTNTIHYKQQRDLSTPSSRLVGHWISEDRKCELYYKLVDPSLRIGTFIVDNWNTKPSSPMRFKILSEGPKADDLIIREFMPIAKKAKLELAIGEPITQSAITHCIPKHGQSMTREYTSLGEQMLEVYHYVDDKTNP
jgi:hypothetical protein